MLPLVQTGMVMRHALVPMGQESEDRMGLDFLTLVLANPILVSQRRLIMFCLMVTANLPCLLQCQIFEYRPHIACDNSEDMTQIL